MRNAMSSVMVKLTAFFFVLAILGTGISFGQEEASETGQLPEPKSETIATLLSVMGTAVPVFIGVALRGGSTEQAILVFGGLAGGPALGCFYGELPVRGFTGFVVRSICLVSTIYGLAYTYVGETWGELLLVAGGVGYVLSAISDIVSAGSAVRKRNAALRETAFFISPIVSPQKKTAGISFCFQF